MKGRNGKEIEELRRLGWGWGKINIQINDGLFKLSARDGRTTKW